MAKSNGFWGKRRGSAGSLTFSVLNGKQVTKEKVTSVRNPKTQFQARQRMITSLATKFAAAMRGIVDHSFQNIAYGEKSVQHFLSMAMKFGEGNLIPIAKGGYGFQPENFVISEGTLGTVGVNNVNDDTAEIVNIVKNAPDYANFLQSNPNFKDGDQLTIVAVGNSTEHYEEVQTLGGYASRDNYAVMDRIVLNDANCADIESVQTENAQFEINLKTGSIEWIAAPNGHVLSGMAVILSRRDDVNGKWLRSTETMAVASFNTIALNRQYQADLATFMPAAASMNSDRYLNQAERSQEASTIYVGAYAIADPSAANLNSGTIMLAVKDSNGVYHAVTDGEGDIYQADIDVASTIKPIQMFEIAGNPSTGFANGKLIEPKMKWSNTVTGTLGSAISLGEDVEYVDVADFLFAQ